MSIYAHEVGSRNDIVAINYMTNAQLEVRFVLLTDAPPPWPTNRALLITAVADETLRKPHRERLVAGLHREDANVANR